MPGCTSGSGAPSGASSAVKAGPAGGLPSGAETSSAIPERPERLKFPPLSYEPPEPAGYRAVLKTGPVVYIAEDRELPLVNVNILVRTGEYVEPQDKVGLSGLAGYLVARGGTATRTAEELEERLAFLAAQLSSGVGESQGSVSLNLLSKDIEEGLVILREVLTAPRFQEDKLALARQQTLQGMRERNDDSSSIESREAGFLAYGEDFWANRYSTEKSVQSITREDLLQFHRTWFHPSNFVVAVNGDFSRADMRSGWRSCSRTGRLPAKRPRRFPRTPRFAKPGV